MENIESIQTIIKANPDKQSQIRDIIYQIRRLIQVDEYYTKALNKSYQVSVPQLNCLLALFESGPLPLSKLANLIMVKSSTVTGIIDRLEQKGLVQRMRDSHDRRVIFIELTENGHTLAKNAPPPIQQKIVDGLNRLTVDELKEIVRCLRKLADMH